MTRHAAVLTALFLLTACSSGPPHTARLLDQRLNASLSTEVSSGRATVQALPDGDRVTLLEPSLFPANSKTLDNQTPDVRANVIQALLDPSLMRVQVADTSTLPDYQRDLRVRNVSDYFVANGLQSVLVPAGTEATPAGTAGLVLTIRLACPSPDGFIGYRDGGSRPICD